MVLLDPIYYVLVVGFILVGGFFFEYPYLNLKFPNIGAFWPAWIHNSLKNEAQPKPSDDSYQANGIDRPEDQTLSRKWWQDGGIFQLENRAIFCKTWLCVSHTCRFQKPGDYRTFDIAGLSIIVILGKDKRLRSFQNVCRHRAYQVTKKVCGSSTVLGCRYHGWSYDTTGKLIKAPEFENISGFDKSMNGLWVVKLEVRNSMVFLNLDSSTDINALIPSFDGSAFSRWNSGDLHCITEWNVDGCFNWKLAAGEFPDKALSEKLRMLEWMVPLRFRRYSGYLPLGYTTRVREITPGVLILLRFLPKTPDITMIEACVLAVTSDFPEIELKKIKTELGSNIDRLEKKQIEISQGNGTFVRELQEEFRAILNKHANAEEAIGREIQPAAQKQDVTTAGKIDDDFCRELEMGLKGDSICSASARGLLDW